jgi:pimeloyl-ACP methyl ester carboxylesterase
LHSITRTIGLLVAPERRLTARAWKTLDVPRVEREAGVSLFWQEWGEGPGLLVMHSYLQHPTVLEALVAEISPGHRMLRYDARGTGESTRVGPYDMQTDVDDLIAIVEATGPVAAVLSNGDASNRAMHAAVARPDLIPYLISMETVPLMPGQAADTDALVGSGGVLSALVRMVRADYRSGMMAAIQRGNPDMTPDQLRERLDATVAYCPHEAGLGRLEAWIADDPGEDPYTLGERLIVAYEGAGAWFTEELHQRGQELLPDAQFVKLDGGAVSRPDLTAAVVRRVTGAAATAS